MFALCVHAVCGRCVDLCVCFVRRWFVLRVYVVCVVCVVPRSRTRQVEQYACLYTSKVSNLGLVSPEMNFRTQLDFMPHDQVRFCVMCLRTWLDFIP